MGSSPNGIDADGRLIQETNNVRLHLIASILVLDGRIDPLTFELMMDEGTFPKLISLIMEMSEDEDHLLRRRLMELLYEMSRIQRIRREDLGMKTSRIRV